MKLKIIVTGILLALVIIVSISFLSRKKAKDDLADRPELGWPLADKKLVIAHCMTNIIRYRGHKLEDSCDPAYYAPTGNSTAPLGGLTQVNVLSDHYLRDKTLDEAVEFEMRAAIKAGIDGFQFYYTLGNKSSDTIINAYLKVATQKNIDFKFTFCISHPSGGSEQSRIDEFAQRINEILNAAGRNNPHWIRTPDGRLVLYTWYGDGLADIPPVPSKPEAYYVAGAYKKLEAATGEKFAMVISINEQISEEKLNSYLDYFPAVWLWTLPYTENYIGERVASTCKKRNRTFTGSAFPGFYTSKLIRRGTWDMFHLASEAVVAGREGAERKYIVTGLSYNFRKQLEFSIDKDVPIINIITWNDYPEGHHLAPEVNHNDGFSLLLQHYKSAWTKKASPLANEEVLVAFYKKYRHDIEPSPFSYPVIEIERPGVAVAIEDSVEVVSFLKEKGELHYGKVSKLVNAGMQVNRFPATPGAVIISLKRNGAGVDRLVCPEWITEKPYRTDRLTYSFSTQTTKTYRELFGDPLPLVSEEYNANAKENCIQLYAEPK